MTCVLEYASGDDDDANDGEGGEGYADEEVSRLGYQDGDPTQQPWTLMRPCPRRLARQVTVEMLDG
jgi:hypothetical protein